MISNPSASSPGAGNSSASRNSSTAPSLYDGSGLAVNKPDGSSVLYQYYQDAQGRIIENQYSNGENGQSRTMTFQTILSLLQTHSGVLHLQPYPGRVMVLLTCVSKHLSTYLDEC